jgi:hypothetical protein
MWLRSSLKKELLERLTSILCGSWPGKRLRYTRKDYLRRRARMHSRSARLKLRFSMGCSAHRKEM